MGEMREILYNTSLVFICFVFMIAHNDKRSWRNFQIQLAILDELVLTGGILTLT